MGWQVIVDAKALDECAMKAEETLQGTGIPHPNMFKIAGHYAFWIRKLKPFSLYKRDELVRLLDAIGVGSDLCQLLPAQNRVDRHSDLFVNEIIAVFVAIGLLRYGLPAMTPSGLSSKMLNDLIVGLRHHSYSPSSLAILMEAIGK